MGGLNQDMITEILLRLPVKSVFRFKLVCRDWLQYVMCPLFSQRYRSHHGPSTLTGFLHTSSSGIHFCPVNNRLEYYPSRAVITRRCLFRNLRSTQSIVASSDGRLLLVEGHNGWEFLCNSITGELFKIPEFLHWAHGVGIIHQEPHVKLVFAYHTRRNRTTDRILCWTKYIMFKTFTTETNQWTTSLACQSNIMCLDYKDRAGVVVGDAMYWMCLTGDVLQYKVSSAEGGDSKMISLPYQCCSHNANSLHCGSDGSLYYCSNDSKEVKIWVLSDDHNMSSWCMKYKVCLGESFGRYLGRAFYVCLKQEVMFMWFYDPWIDHFGGMIKFGLKDGKMEVVYRTGRDYFATSIVPYFSPQWPAASFVRTESMI